MWQKLPAPFEKQTLLSLLLFVFKRFQNKKKTEELTKTPERTVKSAASSS